VYFSSTGLEKKWGIAKERSKAKAWEKRTGKKRRKKGGQAYPWAEGKGGNQQHL